MDVCKISRSAEDSTGPTTTCEISTFDPEPNIELPFDADQTLSASSNAFSFHLNFF